MDFTYVRQSTHEYPETIEAVEREIRARGFVVDAAYDVTARLRAKGFDIQPLQVYEVSLEEWPEARHPEELFASQCRIHVFTEDGAVHIRAIRPTALCRIIADAELADRAVATESLVLELIDAAAG